MTTIEVIPVKHFFPRPSVAELVREERLLTSLFHTLEENLRRHTETPDEYGHTLSYHATVSAQLRPPNLGYTIIHWDCHYCRTIYKHAQYLNRQRTLIQKALHAMSPTQYTNEFCSTDLTDPLSPPFRRISTTVINDLLAYIARLAEPTQGQIQGPNPPGQQTPPGEALHDQAAHLVNQPEELSTPEEPQNLEGIQSNNPNTEN